MLSTITIFTLFLVIITALPLSRNKHWLIRDLDFPRLQILTLASATLLSIFVFLSITSLYTWILAAVCFICFVWQLWWILPYSPFWKPEVIQQKNCKPENRLSIITSNVLTTNRNSKALIDLVHEYNPDLLLTLESDQWWEDQLNVFEDVMPHTIKCPLDNLYGMHLYSKLELHDAEISFLVEEDVPSFHVTVELRNGDKVRTHFLHPAPPSPTENTESGERDAELIIVAKSVSKCTGPVIVTGDLNDVAWSKTTRLFRKISRLLDPRIGRGTFNTFHAKYPLLRWPLDHIFHSKHFTLCSIQRLPSIGSDHFPLFTSLAINPIEGRVQRGITAESKDREEADTIAQDKDVDEDDVPVPKG